MTKDEIIKLAREAGVRDDGYRFEFSEFRYLERFFQAAYAAGAAAEREACASICDEHADDPVYCGAAIRARGNT